jgi:heme-degrading monooxygenase HmoA
MSYVSEMGVTIRPEYADAFKESYQKVMEIASNQPGFISLQALNVLNDPKAIRYDNYAKFETLEDMNRWARDGYHKQLQEEGKMRFFSSFYLRRGRELCKQENAEGKILLETTITPNHTPEEVSDKNFEDWIVGVLSSEISKNNNLLPYKVGAKETLQDSFLFTKVSYSAPLNLQSKYVILTYWKNTNDCSEWERSDFNRQIAIRSDMTHKRFLILQDPVSRCPVMH